MPDAVVSAEGVYLDGAAGWYPRFGDALATFELEVSAPAGWEVVSQGERATTAAGVRWVGSARRRTTSTSSPARSSATRTGGRGRARGVSAGEGPRPRRRYLDALARYVAIYRELLGPYPYAKFAVVENRWQTGYGMPSFTLLGSRVLRLPFILDSSLPHELLHNWWGNGVLVDLRDGNWSEGLTAYLADYSSRRRRGRGRRYRRGALQRYENFAASAAMPP